jgi:hypothetical protein
MLSTRGSVRRWSTLLLVFCLLAEVAPAAQSKPLELKWNELSSMIAGHRVELTLPEGATIQGEAVAVREDTLVIDVQKSSGAKAYPKGSATIPRASVNLIKLERARGSAGRTLGTIGGVLTGLVVGGYTAAVATDNASTAIPLFLGMATGISIAGYYLGRAADRRVTLIRVVP